MFTTFVVGEAFGAMSLTTAAFAVMMAYTVAPLDVYLRDEMETITNSFHDWLPDGIPRSPTATTYHTVTVVFSVWILHGLDA